MQSLIQIQFNSLSQISKDKSCRNVLKISSLVSSIQNTKTTTMLYVCTKSCIKLVINQTVCVTSAPKQTEKTNPMKLSLTAALFYYANHEYDRSLLEQLFCAKTQTALLSPWMHQEVRGLKNRVPILRCLSSKNRTKKGSELSFIFRVYLPANGACGKKMSNKEVALPLLWQSCTQRPFMWRTTLTKTAQHNIAPLPNKGSRLKRKGGRRGVDRV